LLIPCVAVIHCFSNIGYNEMLDFQRAVEVQDPPAKSSRLSSAQTGRKVTICLLAALIVSVMIVWFGFLGWGFVTILQRLLDSAKDFLAHF
jgi:hypothetical protein